MTCTLPPLFQAFFIIPDKTVSWVLHWTAGCSCSFLSLGCPLHHFCTANLYFLCGGPVLVSAYDRVFLGFHPLCPIQSFCCGGGFLVVKLCLILCDPMNYSMPGLLFFTIFWRLLKFMSIKLVLLSNQTELITPLSGINTYHFNVGSVGMLGSLDNL